MTTKLRLSQIKLAGFKSFVDPTHIHLPGQIVGVVGPNGCGKSNVIDALRWVLGESKASALRGESMQDVIFNGSGKRRPVSRASVELVFDNSLGKAAGQWSSYAEISIKRVLQRNGDSSYYINTQKVRRRDITDIFLGTGLGARAYAIIEQGMISRIIEAKPEELRVFLEEAAGVSRYRDRRRDTSQRLNDTRDNLLRVADVLEELDRQLLHLGDQAETARQYRELAAQRDTAQHLLWLVKKQEAEAQRAQHQQNIEKTRTALEAETARLREAEKRIEASRSLHQQLSDALNSRQGELYEANAQIAQLEQQIRHVAAERQRIQAQIANTERQLAHQRQQREEVAGMLEHWRDEQQVAAESLAEAEMVAQQQGERLPEIEEQARAAQQNHHALQREQLQLQQRLQLADTQLAGMQRNIGQFEARRARLQQEQAGLSRPDVESLQLMQQELAELEMLCAERQEGLSRLQEQSPYTERACGDARAALQQHERAASQSEARLHALQQLQRQLDNDRNMQGWLQRHGLEQLPRLWQSVRIEAGWEDALEAALRERLNAFALSGRDELMGWTDAPPGKLALFALADPGAQPAGPVSADGGAFPPLLDYLECQDPRVTPALGEWLAGVYAAADLASAQARSAHLPPGACFVTPQGHLVSRSSVLFHAPDSQLHGVLGRQAEIVRLEQVQQEQQQAVAAARQQLAESERQHRAIESQMPPLRNEVNALQQRQHGLQLRALKLMQDNERSAERAAVIERELQEAGELLEAEQSQRQTVLEQAEAARAEIAAFHAQLQQAAHQAEHHDRAAREQRGRVQQAQHALQEARFYDRSCGEKRADLQRNLEQLAASVAQADQTLAALHEDFGGVADEQARHDLQQALEARQLCEQALSAARGSLEAEQQEMQHVERVRLSSEQQLNQMRDRLNALALKEQEARLYFEQWAEQLRGVDELVLLPQLAAGLGKPAALQAELNRLEAAIVALGAVNLAALEELQAATERKQYLDAQASDLQEAMATLEEAIRRIDRESRELLMATYDQVNRHLAELFPVLFAGGEARLVLTGEEILDSGVQVMAQPPGKKNSTIHLLSGGEKALTAIALVFSLFQLNPAPFCLLDEVDAPLDDTNTERLCALIRRMAQQTQFVFISHNKIAMEMALQLVGVTMQEKGVSKIVSVDIEEALRMRDDAG